MKHDVRSFSHRPRQCRSNASAQRTLHPSDATPAKTHRITNSPLGFGFGLSRWLCTAPVTMSTVGSLKSCASRTREKKAKTCLRLGLRDPSLSGARRWPTMCVCGHLLREGPLETLPTRACGIGRSSGAPLLWRRQRAQRRRQASLSRRKEMRRPQAGCVVHSTCHQNLTPWQFTHPPATPNEKAKPGRQWPPPPRRMRCCCCFRGEQLQPDGLGLPRRRYVLPNGSKEPKGKCRARDRQTDTRRYRERERASLFRSGWRQEERGVEPRIVGKHVIAASTSNQAGTRRRANMHKIQAAQQGSGQCTWQSPWRHGVAMQAWACDAEGRSCVNRGSPASAGQAGRHRRGPPCVGSARRPTVGNDTHISTKNTQADVRSSTIGELCPAALPLQAACDPKLVDFAPNFDRCRPQVSRFRAKSARNRPMSIRI